MEQLYKIRISNILQKFINNHVNIQYIYGGITNQKPPECDQYDIIAVYSFTENLTRDEEIVINLENHLINILRTYFNTKCLNVKNSEFKIDDNLAENRIYFYVHYKIFNQDD